MKLAFISDIHEDIEYLSIALKKIEKLRCDEIACLGDIVGFSVPHYKHYDTRNANACINLIAQNCKYAVAGNHDHYAIRKLPQYHPIKHLPTNWYSLSFDQRKQIADGRVWLYEDNELSALLNDNSIEWLSEQKEYSIIENDHFKILISHFIYPDITGFTTEYLHHLSHYESHHRFLTGNNAHLSVFGHVHVPKLHLFDIDGNAKYSKKSCLSSKISGIGLPAIVRNTGKSGFMVLDTLNQVVEIHYI